MAARFPQSATSVAYQIKAAYASKIHVIYWAADADSVHRLRSGDTASTIVTRSASGATFNSTDGLIEGSSSGAVFTDSITGGYGGLQENSNFCFGASYWGDLFNGIGGGASAVQMIGTVALPDLFTEGLMLRGDAFGPTWHVQSGAGNGIGGVTSNDVVDWITLCIRHDQADGTADIRPWLNGSELTSNRTTTASPSSTDLIGTAARPLRFGQTKVGTGNTKMFFEAAWFAGVLSDAEMAAITANPADVIEAYTPPAGPSIPVVIHHLRQQGIAA